MFSSDVWAVHTVGTQYDNCGLGYQTRASFPPHAIISGNVSWGNDCEFWIQLISPLSLPNKSLHHLECPEGLPHVKVSIQLITSWVHKHFLNTHSGPTRGNVDPYLDTEMVRHNSRLPLRQLEGARRKGNKLSKEESLSDVKWWVHMSVLWDKVEEI